MIVERVTKKNWLSNGTNHSQPTDQQSDGQKIARRTTHLTMRISNKPIHVPYSTNLVEKGN